MSRRTGIDRDEIRRTKKHVAAFNEYPVLAGKDWSRSDATAAAESLGSISAADRKTVLDILDEPVRGCQFFVMSPDCD